MSGRPHNHYDSVKMTDAAQSAEASADREAYQDFDRALKGDTNQFTVVPDPDHRDISRLQFLSTDQSMSILQKNGFKNIAIERPPLLQPFADDLASGKISREEFIQKMEKNYATNFQQDEQSKRAIHGATADMILNAKKHGITIHFADADADPTTKLPKVVQDFEDRVEKKARSMGLKPGSADWDQKLTELGRDEMMKLSPQKQQEFMDSFLSSRLNNDSEVAKGIKGAVGNEKTMVFYGVEHTDKKLGRELAKPNPGQTKGPGLSEIELIPSQQGMSVVKKAQPEATKPSLSSVPKPGGP